MMFPSNRHQSKLFPGPGRNQTSLLNSTFTCQSSFGKNPDYTEPLFILGFKIKRKKLQTHSCKGLHINSIDWKLISTTLHRMASKEEFHSQVTLPFNKINESLTRPKHVTNTCMYCLRRHKIFSSVYSWQVGQANRTCLHKATLGLIVP